jgi:hypothetical protein
MVTGLESDVRIKYVSFISLKDISRRNVLITMLG